MQVEIKIGENQLKTTDIEFAKKFLDSMKDVKTRSKSKHVYGSLSWSNYDTNVVRENMNLVPADIKPLLLSKRTSSAIGNVKAKIKKGIL
jgi:hypothetical protein